MKCIDAVEGTAKSVLKQLYSAHRQACTDDSEYIEQVKAVIAATEHYVKQNPELMQDTSVLRDVLYVYSRNIWLMGQQSGDLPPVAESMDRNSENNEYQTYYYDYLYDRGVYPN